VGPCLKIELNTSESFFDFRPIDEIPPTRVTDLSEIIAETDPQFLAFVETVKRLNAELTGVWGELLVEFLECHVCNKIYNLLQEWHSKNFSRRTTLRWFQRAVELLGYQSTTITISTGNRGPVNLKVYHDGNLDASKIKQTYAELKGGASK